MAKKQYKVIFEDGQIKPLEPIALEKVQEGIVVFYEDENEFNLDIPMASQGKLALSKDALKSTWDNPEDDIYNDL